MEERHEKVERNVRGRKRRNRPTITTKERLIIALREELCVCMCERDFMKKTIMIPYIDIVF